MLTKLKKLRDLLKPLNEKRSRSHFINQTEKFHDLFGVGYFNSPGIPSGKICRLRVDLLKEELEELRLGVLNKDIVEIADALCDLQYVLSGAVLSFGLQDKFKELFDEVHRSNMSKACKDIKEATETSTKYGLEGIPTEIIQKEDQFIVKNLTNGKILKSVGYSPADLKTILEK